MRRKTIRMRFYRELLVFGVLMVMGSGIGLIQVYFWGLEDATKLSYMDLAESVAVGEIPDEVLENDWPETNPQVWRGVENIPVNVLKLFPKRFHRSGELLVQYEYSGQAISGEPSYGLTFNFLAGPPDRVHFFLTYPAAAGLSLYVYHESAAGLSAQTRQQTVFLMVSANCVALLLVVIFLARRLSGVVLKPVSDLSTMASLVDQQSDRDFAVAQQPNEIGDVARTLQQSVQRLHEFHEREKQFLRQASHELRTPIAVIASALDVLDQRRAAGNTDVDRPLDDIRRSTGDMRDIVEALLWLARADTLAPERSATDVAQQIAALVADHRYLLAGKAISVDTGGVEPARIEVEQPYFRIVLSNLIRNAFEHTTDGPIEIACGQERFVIKNRLPGSGKDARGDSAGFGIGMTVIKAISEKLGWTFSTSVADGAVVVELAFLIPDTQDR